MRLMTAITLSACLLAGCTLPPRQGFEPALIQGELTSGVPPGWVLRGPRPAVLPEGIDVYLDGGVRQSGHMSASIVATDASMNDFGSLEQDVTAEPYRGQRVRFSGHVKTNAVFGWAGLVMRVDTETKQSIAADDMGDRPISGTTDWTRYDVVLDVDEYAEVITFGISLHGEGQVWLDDCSLEIVDRDVKTTDQYPRGFDRRVQIPVDLNLEPENLGFEDLMFGE